MKIVQIVSHHGVLFALDEKGLLWCGHFRDDRSGGTDLNTMTWTRVSFSVND